MSGGYAMANAGRRRSWPEFYADHRFAGLLAILVMLSMGTPVLVDLSLPVIWLDGLMALLLLAAILSLCFEPHERIFALALGIPGIVSIVASNALAGPLSDSVLVLGRICQVLFLFGAAIVIVKSLFRHHKFTFDSVFGAVCGYLFLGLGWSVVFMLTESFRPGSFQVNEALLTADEPNLPLALLLSYFSFVTLTTVGFGDILPMTPSARTFALIEAITGQFYLAIVVAGLVNTMAGSNDKPPPARPS